jgi:hypothetical protein
MNKSDFSEFQQLLSACLGMWDAAPKPEAIAIWFVALAEYDLATVRAGFNAHMRDPANGKFAPKPAHIIEQIRGSLQNDGRLGPEEAWARAVRARDESETVVWSNEMRQAWFAASEVMSMGDEVGARMAFKEVYARLVSEARARREPVAWEVSEGFDKERRMTAITEAVEAGLIPPRPYMALGNASSVVAGLLEGNGAAPSGIPPEIRERIRQLRESFAAPYSGPSEAELERERTAELKRQQQAALDRYLSQLERRA